MILKDARVESEKNVIGQKQEFEALKQEVFEFRLHLLDLYKKHLQLIDAIPSNCKTSDNKISPEVPVEHDNVVSNSSGTEQIGELKNNPQEYAPSNSRKYILKNQSKFKDLQFGESFDISSV
jgi:hypothetical protein